MLIKTFIEHFTSALTATLKKNTLDKFAKACVYALKEACEKHKEITPDNFSEIAKEYFAKLAVLAANAEKRHGAAKVHWISQSAASFAESIFQETYNQYVKPKEPILNSYHAHSNGPGNPSAFSTFSKTAVNKPTLPLTTPATTIAKTPASPAVVSSSSQSSEKDQKTLNDNASFNKYDNDYSGYSETDKSDMYWAENCCSFPKLALYLAKNKSIDIRTAAININLHIKLEHKNEAPETLTPAAVLETYKTNRAKAGNV